MLEWEEGWDLPSPKVGRVAGMNQCVVWDPETWSQESGVAGQQAGSCPRGMVMCGGCGGSR